MALYTNFQAVASGDIIRLRTLEVDRGYSVVFARRLTTQYGETILLTFEPCGSFRGPLCLLPRHFRSPFTSLHSTLFLSYWLQVWGEGERRSGGGVLLGFWGNLEENILSLDFVEVTSSPAWRTDRFLRA